MATDELPKEWANEPDVYLINVPSTDVIVCREDQYPNMPGKGVALCATCCKRKRCEMPHRLVHLVNKGDTNTYLFVAIKCDGYKREEAEDG